MTDLLELQEHGAVRRIIMTAPHSLNALSDEMLAALMAALDQIEADPRAKVVILSGAGRAFCAGHDLRQMQAARSGPDGGAAYFADLFARCAALMLRLNALPQPVIAQVHGIATAAGCQLVASCDLAVAAAGTRFGVNGVNIGLFCSTPMVALTRAVPRKLAFEMLATGAFIDAERAQAHGLINSIAAPEALADTAMELAQTLAQKLGPALRIGKGAFYAQSQMGTAEAYDYAAEVMTQNMLMADTNEGICAFLDKRPPNWG